LAKRFEPIKHFRSMNSIDIDVIRTALDWLNRGHRVVMGTVVRTWGSAPRPPGSLMIIRDDGQVAGSVSGGCIEDDLIRRVAAGELALRMPETTTYGQTAEEVRRFGLPCGGSVQVVLEPLSAQSQLRELLVHIEQHQRVERRMDMATGMVRMTAATEGDKLQFDGQSLTTVHGPRLRLLDFDVSEAEVQQLHGPVGLNIGALTPPEIAMSIVAEMTAMRRGTDLSQALSNWQGSKTVCGLA
jgi:xanthine/CO dehydrogenase XdhC/CoxF family maturation factor